VGASSHNGPASRREGAVIRVGHVPLHTACFGFPQAYLRQSRFSRATAAPGYGPELSACTPDPLRLETDIEWFETDYSRQHSCFEKSIYRQAKTLSWQRLQRWYRQAFLTWYYDFQNRMIGLTGQTKVLLPRAGDLR
jgi:hypothetical protein